MHHSTILTVKNPNKMQQCIKISLFLILTLRLLMSYIYIYIYIYIYMERLFLMFLDHTQRCSTVGRTHLDEWSARRRDLYLTTHDTHNRQISMPPVGFEPKISAGERPCRLTNRRYWSLYLYFVLPNSPLLLRSIAVHQLWRTGFISSFPRVIEFCVPVNNL